MHAQLRRSFRLLLALLLVLTQLMMLAPATAHAAPTVSVNSTGDGPDATPGDGICDTGLLNADGTDECTLRAAIEEANASVPVDEIAFAIPVTDPGYTAAPLAFTIQPATNLPDITGQVSIDATTQPGHSGSPVVVVDGSNIPAVSDGLDVLANQSIIRGLVIRDLGDEAIALHGDFNTVVGNHLLDADDGVLVLGTGNVIGGEGPGEGNVVSGGSDDGISIDGAHQTEVYGNWVGLDVTGATAHPNAQHGVAVQFGATETLIGPGNVVSGNGEVGIHVGQSTGTTVVGTVVGLDAAGTGAVPNGIHGISITADASDVVVGGTGSEEGNVVSSNTVQGIDVVFGAAGVAIRNNHIGTDLAGSTAHGNGGDGIRADADEVAIGGAEPGEGNVIAFNGGAGVSLPHVGGTSSFVVSNLIYGNGGLGIDLLDDGPTANDAGDVDSGPNDLLNHPVITDVSEVAGTVYAVFELDVPASRYRVELFVNPSGPDPTGFGEGEVLASSLEVDHPGGVGSYSLTFDAAAGDDVSATVTRCEPGCESLDITSEFSENRTIVVGNLAPSLDPISNPTVDEGTPVVFTAVANDPDPGDALTFGLNGAPAGASIDPITGEFTWTPTEAVGPGSYTFVVTVTDDGSPASLGDTTEVTITVTEVNLPPVLADPGDRVVAEQTTLDIAIAAFDPDDPANDLAFSLNGAPVGAAIDALSGQLTWAPSESQGPGVYTFDVIVTDDGDPALSDTKPITVTVVEVNGAPVVSDPGSQSTAEGGFVDLTISASDPDDPADGVTFSASGLPPGLAIDPATGRITGTVQYHAAVASPHTVTVTVADDGSPGLAGQVTFTWVTPNTNRPPVLGHVSNQVVDEQKTLTFVVSSGDPDAGTVPTYSLVGAPAGASIDPVTGEFRWTPGEARGPGLYTFTVVVTDSDSPTLSDIQLVRVRVREVNRAPHLVAPGNQVVDEQETLTFVVVASDPDLPANTLTYGLVGAPEGAVIDPGTGVFSWSPTENRGPGLYSLTVTVSDDASPQMMDTATVTVRVREVNRPPVLQPLVDRADAEGDIIDLTLSARDPDLPRNLLVYTATGLPPGIEIDRDTGRISGTIRHHAAPWSPYMVTVSVSDGADPLLTDAVSFTWEVANTNRAPQFTPLAPLTVDESTTLRLTVPATDPDPGSVLTFTLLGAPPGVTLDQATGAIEWTPTEADGPGVYALRVRVTDDDGAERLRATQVIRVTVNEVNTAPVARNDTANTREDQSITTDVLANDRDVDLPANDLQIVSVSQPTHGVVDVTDSGKLLYTPPLHFHGTVVFHYTLGDGNETVTALVTVEVDEVNDSPVAEPDRFRMTEYQPAPLDVLANDSDADDDPLGISLVELPEVGEATVADGHIVYKPRNGWTGSVELTYSVSDPSGGTDEATVVVMVGEEVLVGAQELARSLGNDDVNFEPPPPSLEVTGISLIDLGGITLLADSFFQTVDALRIPLGFLGFTVIMIVGFGTASELPALMFGTRRRHWAVVRLGRQQRLPAYSEPGGRQVVYNYDPTAAGIVSTGRIVKVGNTEWVPVDTPNGAAWIYRNYLTEQVDLQAFAADRRPAQLIRDLADRLRKGRPINSLVSAEGLLVALTGSPSQIPSDRLAVLMGDSRLRHLPGIGRAPATPEEFTVAVAKPFLEALDVTPELTAAVPHSRSALIPTECWNFPYLAIGTNAEGVQPWLVFFEYRDGKAWIAGLGIDE